jgi:hypothetical protein
MSKKTSQELFDGKLRPATIEECNLNWCGAAPGARFLCRLCGYKFQPGDLWRLVYANGKESPSRYGNFMTCSKCDGPDILERAAKQEKEYKNLKRLFGDDINHG